MVDKYVTVSIKRDDIEARIGELSLKKHWLAEQIGVDKGTFSRWLNGKIKRVRKEHVEQLSQLLECEYGDIVSDDDDYGSKADQRAAAELIETEDLFSVLASSAKFELLTKIIKSSLNPYLPKKILGELYNTLGMAIWYLDKPKQSKTYIEKALNIGVNHDHNGIKARALLSLAGLAYNEGDLDTGRKFIESSLEIADGLVRRDQCMAKVLRGYETFLRGELQTAYEEMVIIHKDISSAEHFPMKLEVLNIASTFIAEFALSLTKLQDAMTAIKAMKDTSNKANYVFGLNLLPVFNVWRHAIEGDTKQTREAFNGVNESFLWPRLYKAKVNAILARSARLIGDQSLAEQYIQQGLDHARDDLPLHQAELLMERLLLTQDKAILKQLTEIYRESKAYRRLEDLPSLLDNPSNHRHL